MVRHRLDEGHHGRIDPDLLPFDSDGVFPAVEAGLDLPCVLGPQQDFDLLRPKLVRGTHGVHVDLDVDAHPVPGVLGSDDVELLRPALADNHLSEGADRVEAELVVRLHRDSRHGPIPLDPRAPLRLERGLEAAAEEVHVGVHLIVRDLEGPGLLRGHDRRLDLMGNLLRRTNARIRDAFQHLDPLIVSAFLDALPGPGEEVVLSVSLQEPAFEQRRDLADGRVLKRPERDAVRLRGEEDLPQETADPREFRGIAGPGFEPHAEGVVDLLEDLDRVEREDRGLLAADGDCEVGLRAAGREDEASLRLRASDPLPSVRERLVHEGLHQVLEVRGAGRFLGRQVGTALVGDEGPGGVEQEGVVDRVAALRLDPDDRRVRRLVLPVVKGPRVVHLEVQVHRPDLLRLQAELEGRLLVRLESLDRLQS